MTRNEFDPVVMDRVKKLPDAQAAGLLVFVAAYVSRSNDDFAAELRQTIADRVEQIERSFAIPQTFLGV